MKSNFFKYYSRSSTNMTSRYIKNRTAGRSPTDIALSSILDLMVIIENKDLL